MVLVAAAGALIGVYVWVVNFSRSHLRSKAVVGLTGAGAALLGFLGGAGVCFMSGVISTGTAAAAPLLVVGIGVDDTLVILQSYSLTVHKRSAADRLQLTLRDSGVGITITTLTNLITFGIGAFSPYLAIQSFCLLCSAGLLLGYIMCLTFFLGFLALDAKAEAARRVMGIFRCCPMGILKDSAPVKAADHANRPTGSQERKGIRTIKGLPTLQYLDKTKIPGADASALSACASDIFQCITMQVEAALQRQQQQKLLEAETRRLRKQKNSKKKQQKKTARKKKKTAATTTDSDSDLRNRGPISESSDSEDAGKRKPKARRPAAKARAKKAPQAKRAPPRESSRNASNGGSSKSKEQGKNMSIGSSRSSSRKQQQRQRQRRAKALRPALKGRRQQIESVTPTPKQNTVFETACAASKAPENTNNPSQPFPVGSAKPDSKPSVVPVRVARPRGTTVRFFKKSSTAALTASTTLLQNKENKEKESDWKDRVVVNLCVGSGSAVVAAAAEAAEAAFNTAGRSWSGERIARLQLLQRLGRDGLAEPQGNVGSGLRRVLVRFGARLLMNPFFKLMLLAIFAAVLITAVVGCAKIRTGLDPRSLTKEHTMLKASTGATPSGTAASAFWYSGAEQHFGIPFRWVYKRHWTLYAVQIAN